MNRITYCIAVLAIIYICSCISPNEPNNRDQPLDVPGKDLIAFKAKFPQENGTHLVLMNFYDRMSFRIVRVDSVDMSGCNIFNYDKTQILMHAKPWWIDIYSFGPRLGGPLGIYEINENKITLLYRLDRGNFEYISGVAPVWFRDDTGFFTGYENLSYFLFEKWKCYTINDDLVGSINPLGADDCDNIVALYSEYSGVDSVRTFYLIKINKNGNILNMVKNDKLKNMLFSDMPPGPFTINNKAINISWDSAKDLFIFSEKGAVERKTKISLTNWDGTYYKSLTSGYYRDDAPVFGPAGNFVMFNRVIDNTQYLNYKFMIVDLRTGEVKEYLLPEDIGAERIYGIDY